MGEHTNGDESPLETVQRALAEELWDGSSATYKRDVAVIQNLTNHPVLFLRNYPNQRVDRQITYLYEVRFTQPSDKIQLTLDDEVFDHKWLTLDEYSQWINKEAAGDDFCGISMVKLNRLGLDRMFQLRS